ncbi:MAG: hypothetical protein RR054_05655 [Clostridia bacterium]
MIIKEFKQLKKWFLLCLIPILGGICTVLVTSLTVSNRLNEDVDNKEFNPFPILLFLLAIIPIMALYFVLAYNFPQMQNVWYSVLAAYVAFTIAGYLNLLYLSAHLKREQSKKKNIAEIEKDNNKDLEKDISNKSNKNEKTEISVKKGK